MTAFSGKKFRTLPETMNQGEKKALPDSFDHAEPHFNTAVCMVLARFWEPRHTVVTIPQDLYSETMMFLHTNISKRESICIFFHNFMVKVKSGWKITVKKNTHLVSGCFLLVISVIVIYIIFEIKYLCISIVIFFFYANQRRSCSWGEGFYQG